MVTKKARPYWHVDAKWVCGILLVPVIGLWLTAAGLYRLTAEESAPQFVRALVSSVFNNPNTDTTLDSPEKLEQQLAPLYNDGTAAVAAAVTDDAAQQRILNEQLRLLSVFTKDTHDKILLALIGWSLVTLLLLALMVLFSYRFGKLASVGVVFIISSLGGVLTFATFQSGTGSQGVRLGTVGPEALRLVGSAFFMPYLTVFLLGIGLLVLAGVGRAVYAAKPDKKPVSDSQSAAPPHQTAH